MKEFIKDKILGNIYWIVITLVLSSMLASKCSNEKATKKDTKEYKTVSSQKEALEVLQVPETIVKKFNKIKTITKYRDRIKIDTIKITYKDSIPCDFLRTGEIKAKEYSFTYESNNKGLEVANFDIQDSLIIVTGTKRKWFWGKETNSIDVSHSNKLIKSEGIRHVEVKEKKKFYDTTLFKVTVGFAFGVAIAR